VTVIVEPPDSPPGELIFRRRVRVRTALAEVWSSRELVRTLAEREIRARYKQALLGFSWAVITPLVLMVVFTVFVRRVADVDTGDVPYPLFAYLGLLPWTFFSTSLSAGGQSLVTNSALLNKIYCPREVFPLASVIVAGVDTIISTAILGVLFVIFTFAPQITSLWIPLLLLVQIGFTIAVTLIISGVLVYLRDLRQALPLILQFGLFATPVAWGIDVVPESLQLPYSIINPLAPVIDGYRRSILFGQAPQWDLLLPAAASTVVMLVVGYKVFKRLETGFADAA
jgi:ABC-2 type transport system permease protein/lipopolysaccharide transport system permease protein